MSNINPQWIRVMERDVVLCKNRRELCLWIKFHISCGSFRLRLGCFLLLLFFLLFVCFFIPVFFSLLFLLIICCALTVVWRLLDFFRFFCFVFVSLLLIHRVIRLLGWRCVLLRPRWLGRSKGLVFWRLSLESW